MGGLLLAIFILGVVIGYSIGKIRNQRQSGTVSQDDYDKLLAENAEYKARVNQHFEESSEMFRNITEQYVKLYNHMSESAVSLYDQENAQAPKLDKLQVTPDEQTTNEPKDHQ